MLAPCSYCVLRSAASWVRDCPHRAGKVSAPGGAGQRKAADPGQQVHDVVLHRDVEQPHRTAAGLAQLCDALATRPITPWGITYSTARQ